MALNIKSVKKNISAEFQWVPIPDWVGVKLLVRSVEYKEYVQQRDLLVQNLTKKHRRPPTNVELGPGLGRLAATLLLGGWDGIVEGEGDAAKPVAFTPDLALEYCTNPEMAEFRAQVFWAATAISDQEIEFVADAEKNSAPPSSST